ncbi:unnamed protein product [Fraxinus pennsylvanica]|uniref:Uncharacterized protein n=1 Tax=Fraxinus pennsylvanica TaxID=56036 RepID=A0AAD1YXL2_9LAMI|nr:unnamed protein product [Fraxinus pennsylvanica]
MMLFDLNSGWNEVSSGVGVASSFLARPLPLPPTFALASTQIQECSGLHRLLLPPQRLSSPSPPPQPQQTREPKPELQALIREFSVNSSAHSQWKHIIGSDGGNKENKARIQRIIVAGKALANVVRIGKEVIVFKPSKTEKHVSEFASKLPSSEVPASTVGDGRIHCGSLWEFSVDSENPSAQTPLFEEEMVDTVGVWVHGFVPAQRWWRCRWCAALLLAGEEKSRFLATAKSNHSQLQHRQN